MQAGKLRHAVDVEELVYGEQDLLTGDVPHVWTVRHALRAAIMPLSSKDLIAAQAVESQVTTRIVTRYVPGITAAMRVVGRCACHAGRVYTIHGRPIEDATSGNRSLTFACAEGPDPDGGNP
jgi:SPP1 family predicted phage head-tail adaptor